MNTALLFADETDYSSFREATKKFKIDIIDTIKIHEEYNNNSGIPSKMGVLRNVVRFAFDNPKGSISDPIQTDNGIAIFNVIDDIKSSYKDFEDVKSSIKRSMSRESKKTYAKELLAKELIDDWDLLANQNDLIEHQKSDTKIIDGTFQSIGKSSELTGTLLGLEPGSKSEIISTFNTVCIIKMISKDDIDQLAYNEAKQNLKKQLINTKKSRGYINWLNDEKKRLEIKDFRSSSY